MPRVLAAALWKRLTQGHIDPGYFFFGEETYLIQEYITTLREVFWAQLLVTLTAMFLAWIMIHWKTP